MSTDRVVDLPPLVLDDAPAAAKLQKREAERPEGKDTLAARVAADADAVIEDTRTHETPASPPRRME
jgi:hypothetical protein